MPSLWEGGQPDVQSKPNKAGVILEARGMWWQPACSLFGSQTRAFLAPEAGEGGLWVE